MEGIPGWVFAAFFAVYGLMVVSLVPALAALGFLLVRRPNRALILFAVALSGEAVACAAFCVLVLAAEHGGGGDRLPGALPLGLIGLSLLLAGAGQLVAALRRPPTYGVALAFAAGAVLVIIVRTHMGDQFLNILGVPWEWLSRLPRWDSLPVALTSLPLAVAGLMCAARSPAGLQQLGPGRGGPGGVAGRPRDR